MDGIAELRSEPLDFGDARRMIAPSDDPSTPTLLKRWLLTDLAEARRELQAAGDRERAIHQARRRLKRVRTLFRVVASVSGSGHADRIAPVRQAFQLLSGARDADAMQKAAERLAAKSDSDASRLLVERLRLHVSVVRATVTPIADVVRLLAVAETEAAALADSIDPEAALRDRLLATYAKGRKLYRRARDADDDEADILHDWRKQVKHRLHIGQITIGSGFSGDPASAKDLDLLAEYLGLEHDFANMSQWMRDDPVLAAKPANLGALTEAISRRRARLAGRALDLGAELYGEPSEKFARRMMSTR